MAHARSPTIPPPWGMPLHQPLQTPTPLTTCVNTSGRIKSESPPADKHARVKNMATHHATQIAVSSLAHHTHSRFVRCTHCRSRNLDLLWTATPKLGVRMGQLHCKRTGKRARRKLRGVACLPSSRQHP
eukprot:scaffold63440_cov63-Phaeocystis_antarctica.AAC.2